VAMLSSRSSSFSSSFIFLLYFFRFLRISCTQASCK
jgi:hypothetical protein